MTTYVGSIRAGLAAPDGLAQRARGAWWFVGLIFAIGLFLIAVGLVVVSELKKKTLSDERDQSLNLVRALALDVGRALADVDATLQAIGQTLEASYFHEATDELRWPLLFGAQREHPTISHIRILNQFGDVVYTKKKNAASTVGDQLAVLYHTHARHDDLHMGPVVDIGSGKHAFHLSRRFEKQGQFAGVIVAEVPSAFVELAFLSIKTERSSILSLVYNDDRIAVRVKDGVVSRGQLVRNSSVMSKIGGQLEGFIDDTSLVDGVRRVYAHAAVGKYGLRLFYGQSLREIELKFWSNVQWLMIIVGLIASVMFVIAWCLGREFRTRIEIEAQLEKQVNYDGLTKLSNRRRLDAVMSEEWNRGARSGTPLAMLMIDADYFKKYNDYYGHPIGDRLLQLLAEQVGLTARRAGEVAARFGGEEFAVILPGLSSREAWQRAEDLRSRIEALAIEHHDHPRGIVTVSIGVASLVPEAKVGGPDDLVVCADLALYDAKGLGRNRVVAFDDTEQETELRLAA